MLLQGYTQKEIEREIKTLKNNKAHGADGIPEEEYKAIKNWITEPMTHMINEIKNGKDYQKNGKKEQ